MSSGLFTSSGLFANAESVRLIGSNEWSCIMFNPSNKKRTGAAAHDATQAYPSYGTPKKVRYSTGKCMTLC
jgi:hypothetical protein